MKVRIISKGWETYTGSLGFQAVFKDGVSVGDLNPRQVARIGSSLMIIDIETGLQVGPAVVARQVQSQVAEVVAPVKTEADAQVEAEVTKEALIAENDARKAVEAAALAEAQAKVEANPNELVVYSRVELEAIGANDGIEGLREIAKLLKVKGRSITDLIDNILKAQTKAVSA